MFPSLSMLIAALTLTVSASPSAAQEDRRSEMRMMGQCGNCIVSDLDYSEARLTGIELQDAEIAGVSFSRAALSLAIFDGARITNVSFNGANLRGASFVGAVLVNVSFDGADLMGAVFEGATLDQTDLLTGRLCKTQLPDDTMARSGCN
ncbi:MAG: pentapeptide repeat-containing protein [Pseudomonadota bacterium]